MARTRIETDSMGPVGSSGGPLLGGSDPALPEILSYHDLMPFEIIHAFGVLKLAAAQTNLELGKLSSRSGHAPVMTAEVLEGKLAGNFPCMSGRRAAAPRPT